MYEERELECKCGHSRRTHKHISKRITSCKVKGCDCQQFIYRAELAPLNQRISYVSNGLSDSGTYMDGWKCLSCGKKYKTVKETQDCCGDDISPCDIKKEKKQTEVPNSSQQ